MENVLKFKAQPKKLVFETNKDIYFLFESFEENFQNGEKSIAFSSTSYQNAQEKCVVLAADYFNKKYPSLRICIVSFSLNKGFFKSFFDEARPTNSFIKAFSSNLDLVNWNKILKYGFVEILDHYDLILWDLPELAFINSNSDFLEQFFVNMDALYIVSLKNKNFDDEDFKQNIFKYYLDHGLDIRMILPWKMGTKKNRKSFISRIKNWFY